MNPSYMAMTKAVNDSLLNLALGKEYKPKDKKETSINGRAFAPGKGIQQEASGPEKEAKVTKHLDQLRADVEARTGVKSTTGYVREGYPCSDMVQEAEEAQKAHAAAIHSGDGRFEAE